jgi:hypothetical protein
VDKLFFIRSALGLGEYSRFTGVDFVSLVEMAAETASKLNQLTLQANCIRSLGNIALARSEHDQARLNWEAALQLYERIPEPYSIGHTHRRLARLGCNYREHHIAAAHEAWQSIDRPDLVAELTEEFGG